MQENNLFEYAILRIVPRVEREEFLNVGVILYCKPKQFLQLKFTLDEKRMKALFPGLDCEDVLLHLKAFQQISNGETGAGPIALLDPASRFRWLTAKRSTVVQTSGVHPGLCLDPGETLTRLHEQLVLS
ncbi:MAG: DUF3037 domain-containing protein [Chitinophagaceae bacterium]|nr:DUF3037 domain-containing protein [Chitinophagaceae bacterium]